ncbi:hypothetical protein N7510_000169 [Penicillium lagena]|uniref:uncharacterized protein n=1 Tax=Penicillium lagena TaxID=94218 RepID=UPI00253FD4A6|nr:uncharacterized protein N7510_000169 [Penicillium lagena]KAJ5623860.1 hypothetical protein N7510_000169 [Penicillium lagena]
MVLLRLRVVVFPREQLSSTRRMFSFLPNHDDPNASLSGSAKPASFLLVVPSPEEVSLAGLSALIQEKWKKLYPDLERLVIKKLLDHENPADDLDPDLTVADVFVDIGKARREGLDQRGTLHVIQKPAPSPPVRFPSVDIDWDSAASRCELQRKTKQENLPSIDEDEGTREASGSTRRASSASALSSQLSHIHDLPDQAGKPSSSAKQRHRGLTISVETNEDNPCVDNHDGSPINILEDFDMPTPKSAKETRSRKRKQSLEQAEPRKEPRLQTSDSPTSTSTPPQRRQRAPSFSGPSRIPADQLSASQRRLGVGIMTSPPDRKPVQRNINRPIPAPNLTPDAHQPILDSAKKLYSILRKESPADGSQKRGSVSFTDDNEPSSSFPALTPTPTEPTGHQSSQKRSPSAASANSTEVRTSFLPPGIPPEMAQKCVDEIEQERREREDLGRMAEDPNTDPKALQIIKRMLTEWTKVTQQEKAPHRRYDRIAKRRQTISKLREELQALTVDRGNEAALPSSSSKASRAVPTPSSPPVAPAEAAIPSSNKRASRAVPTPSSPPVAPAEAAVPSSNKRASRAVPTPSSTPVAPAKSAIPSSNKRASRAIRPTSSPVVPPAPPSASNKATNSNRPTLKGLLEEQRKEKAARAATQQKPIATAPSPRRDIYEESSEEEDSEGQSASDSG